MILVAPCGSGKTRVLLNGVSAVARGMEYRGTVINGNPLGIVNIPLTSIMEDKINHEKSFGMLTMSGKARLGADKEDSVKSTTSKPEHQFFDGTLSHICSHPEGFTTDLGKKILEKNESRIVLHASDELANFMWGGDFRKLGLHVVPGSNRIFSVSGAPFLAMTATLRNPSEIIEVKNLFGMADKICDVIDINPVKQNAFYSKIVRPSNKSSFYSEKGLISVLRTLYLDKFIEDPFSVPTCIMFGRQEDVLGEIYSDIENEIGDDFPNRRRRPWVQYHGATDEQTLKNIHK